MGFEADTTVQPTTSINEGRVDVAAVFADETAFRSWYERSLPTVYGYLFHRCGRNPALAEELTQEAFVEAVRGRRRFRGHADATTWVIGIARHKLVDNFRRALPEAEIIEYPQSGHNVLLDEPDDSVPAIAGWLAEHAK